MALDEYEATRASVDRAIKAAKEGRPSEERCVTCGGIIEVLADPPGGPYTQFAFTCPCKRTSGYLKGM